MCDVPQLYEYKTKSGLSDPKTWQYMEYALPEINIFAQRK
jgi:hypothetical protein